VTRAIRPLILTWLALLALLAATCASAFVPMGAFNVAVNLGIAFVKAALVAWMFMHVASGPVMVRVVAAAGVAWIAVLAALSLFDFVPRLFA